MKPVHKTLPATTQTGFATMVLAAVILICSNGHVPPSDSATTGKAMNNRQDVEQEFAWEIDALNQQRADSDNPAWLQFLSVDTLRCGIYHLAAGSHDGQSPHSEDEVYYVQSGRSKFHMDGQEFDCQPGTLLFVPAHKPHYFHDITEDLTLLVFFSKAAVAGE